MALGIAQNKMGFVNFYYFTGNCQTQANAFACRALHRVKPVKVAYGLGIDVALDCGHTELKQRKRSRHLRVINQPDSMRPDHGAKCLLGQNFQQHGVRYSAVNDVN